MMLYGDIYCQHQWYDMRQINHILLVWSLSPADSNFNKTDFLVTPIDIQ
jgi:hypothetical protein